MLETILAAAPPRFGSWGPSMSGLLFGLITPVATLLITVGVFYVLIKLGSFLDAMKEKTEAGSEKK